MKKILIIDKDIDSLKIYQDAFSSGGFDVRITESTDEILPSAIDFCPDIIILDLMMPKLEGMEILKYLKKERELSKTAVYILTNLSADTCEEEALKNGAKKYLNKALYDPDAIVDIIKKGER